MRYSLRTLLAVVSLAPLGIAVAWWLSTGSWRLPFPVTATLFLVILMLLMSAAGPSPPMR